jgi:hypothetical protein
MKRLLNSKKHNNIFIIIVGILATVVALTVDYSETEIATIIILSLPIVFSLITLLLYYVSHFVIKKYHWIITLLGVLFVVYITIGITLTNFST